MGNNPVVEEFHFSNTEAHVQHCKLNSRYKFEEKEMVNDVPDAMSTIPVPLANPKRKPADIDKKAALGIPGTVVVMYKSI